jgi:riboflavin biosynthesis pyrimidine reductase
VHADARCSGIRVDDQDDLLARNLRIESGASGGIPEVDTTRLGQRSHVLKPLVSLYEAPDLCTFELPAQLREMYGGNLAIRDGSVYANFVSSIDGVVALEGGKAASGGIISGRNEADRFVMGLLRAFADAVVVGAGTVRAEGGRALWTPDFIFPAAADAFRDLRRAMKRESEPQLVIVSARGDLDPADRALQAGALVLTTATSADRLRKSLPEASEVRAISKDDRIGVATIVDELKKDGHRTILTEGGPQLFGQMVASELVDELFLTLSPNLVGQHGEQSFGIVHGVSFGRSPKWSRLLSIRRQESHLFLRYRLKDSSPSPLPGGPQTFPFPSGGG